MMIVALALAANLCAPGFLQQADIPPHGAMQTATTLERDLAPGESTGMHIHHGVEIAYVRTGAVRVTVEGRGSYEVHACEGFHVDRDVRHEVTNIGDGPAALFLTYVIDVGRPVQEP